MELGAETMIELFNCWTQKVIDGEIRDPKRFTDKFAKVYKERLGTGDVPMVSMFEAFVGAFDIIADIQTGLTRGREQSYLWKI